VCHVADSSCCLSGSTAKFASLSPGLLVSGSTAKLASLIPGLGLLFAAGSTAKFASLSPRRGRSSSFLLFAAGSTAKPASRMEGWGGLAGSASPSGMERRLLREKGWTVATFLWGGAEGPDLSTTESRMESKRELTISRLSLVVSDDSVSCWLKSQVNMNSEGTQCSVRPSREDMISMSELFSRVSAVIWSLNSNEVSINEGRVSVGSVEAVPVGSVAKPANRMDGGGGLDVVSVAKPAIRMEGWGGLDIGVGSVAKPANRMDGWGGLDVGSVAKPANRIEGWGGLDVGVGSVAKPSNRIEGWGGLNVGSVGSAPVVSIGSVGSTPEESLGIVGSIAALLSSCEGSAPSASVVS